MGAPRVAVVGGGITGLAAAHRLLTEGAAVTIVEKSPKLGGMILTEKLDGFVVEGGPDSFVSAKGSVIELASELGLAGQIISSRPEHKGSYVWWQGQLHPLPEGLMVIAPSRLSPLMRSSLLSWRGKIRVLGDLVMPRRSHGGDESLESFVVRRLGREVLERIAEPLVAGIHAAKPDTMSLLASFPRFLEMERTHRSLILAARSAASQLGPGDGPSYFASFKEGMGELPAALVRALDKGEIKTGVAATLLRGGNGGTFSVELDDGTELQVQGVVLAVPAGITAALLSEVVPKAATALGGIKQVATATVTLAYQTDEIPELIGSGFVVPSAARRRIMGVSYLSQKWEGRVPAGNFSLIRVFVGGPNGQELALSGSERLVLAVREELATLIGIFARPVLVRTHSWEAGLHQYTLGHLDRVATAEAALGAHPGLAVAGAAFHGIGLNECIRSGRRAAETVLARAGRSNASRAPL